jgi:hypothetical protein
MPLRVEQNASSNQFMVRFIAKNRAAIQVRVSVPAVQFKTATQTKKKELAKVLAKEALQEMLAAMK